MKRLIRNIDPNDPVTYREKSFVTLDVDWAPDPVFEWTIDLLEAHDVEATWFLTHETPLNDRIIKSDLFEAAIHPNFNPQLSGQVQVSAKDITESALKLVQSATSVRSHSMTQSSGLLQMFLECGLTHDANTFIPWSSNIQVYPYHHWNGLIKVPYNWEDDVHIEYGWDYPMAFEAIKARDHNVLDFHPIHLFLNSADMRPYNEAKQRFSDPGVDFLEYVNHEQPGSKDFLLELVKNEIIY